LYLHADRSYIDMADTAAPPSESGADPREIHRADPGERRRTLAIVLLALVCGALLLAAMHHELGVIQTRLLAGDADLAAGRFLWLARASFVLLALVGVVTGAVIGRGAVAVIREQRYPHASARVVRDFTVVRGARAVLFGRIGLGLALAFALAGIVGAIRGWQLLAYFQ
jgi:hypothetical protein